MLDINKIIPNKIQQEEKDKRSPKTILTLTNLIEEIISFSQLDPVTMMVKILSEKSYKNVSDKVITE
jgi:hypothetical protein